MLTPSRRSCARLQRLPLLGTSCLLLTGLLPSQAPPGGYPLAPNTLDLPIQWSDGIVSLVDVRYPDPIAVQPPASGWPTVFCLHGKGGDRKGMETTAALIARRGYFTIAFDIRPYGATSLPPNPPAPDQSHERRILDVAEALYLLEQQFPAVMNDTLLGSHGVSMGGHITFQIAAHAGQPLPLASSWPQVSTMTPVFTAAATRIAILDGVDSMVTANGDLLASEFARGLTPNPPNPAWTLAATGQYDVIRSTMLADPFQNRLPGIAAGPGIAIQMQDGWDDSKHRLRDTVGQLVALGQPFSAVISGPGHDAPRNNIDNDFNRDKIARWFDRHLKGIGNGIDTEPLVECSVTPVSPLTYLDPTSMWPHRLSSIWPPTTPEQQIHLRGNGTLTSVPPTGAEADQVIPHVLPPGYDLGTFLAEGGGNSAATITIPMVTREFVGAPLAAETELFGRPRLTATATVNQTHFQISATLWLRGAGPGDRFLSSGTFGRRATTPGPQQIAIEMRDLAYVLPASAQLVVKLHNLPLDKPPGQNRMHWVPDLHGSVTTTIHISDLSPAILHLPVALRRGLDFAPRFTLASASAGVTLPMTVDAGSARANRLFALVFSFSGIGPPVNVLGETIWLRPDALTSTFSMPGLLDGLGQAAPSLSIAAGVAPPGIRISAAALVYDPPTLLASSPIQLLILN